MPNATVGTATIGLRANTRQFSSGLRNAQREWDTFLNRLSGNGFGSRMQNRMNHIFDRLYENAGRRLSPVFDRIDNFFDSGGVSALAGNITRLAPALGALSGVFAILAGSALSVGLEFNFLTKTIPGLIQKFQPLIQSVMRFVQSTVDVGIEIQNARNSFRFLLGNEGGRFIEWVRDFANETPFDFSGLLKSIKQLIIMGFSARKAQQAIALIGDTVATTTGNIEDVDTFTLVFGRTLALNKAYTRNIQMLVNSQFNAWTALAEHIGVTEQEVQDMVHRGQIDGVTAVQAWLNYMQRYTGSMQNLKLTMSGLLSTVSDEWRTLRQDFSEGVTVPFIQKTVPYIIAGLRYLQDWLKNNKDKINTVINNIGKGILNIVAYVYTIAEQVRQVAFNGATWQEVIRRIIGYFVKWHNINANLISTFYVIYKFLVSISKLSVGLILIWHGIFRQGVKWIKESGNAYREAVEGIRNPLVPLFYPDYDYTANFTNTDFFRRIEQLRQQYLNSRSSVSGVPDMSAGRRAGNAFADGMEEALEERQREIKSITDYMDDIVSKITDKLKDNFRSAREEAEKIFEPFSKSGSESWSMLPNINNGINEFAYMTNAGNIQRAYSQVMQEQNMANAINRTIGNTLFGGYYNSTHNDLNLVNSQLSVITSLISNRTQQNQLNDIPLEGYGGY